MTENCVTVHCELWVSGASLHNSVNVHCDTSLVVVDASDGKGVEIWTSVYGQLAQKSTYLITIDPGGCEAKLKRAYANRLGTLWLACLPSSN